MLNPLSGFSYLPTALIYMLYILLITRTDKYISKSHCYITELNLKKWDLSNFAFQSFNEFVGNQNKKNFFQFLRGILDGRTKGYGHPGPS